MPDNIQFSSTPSADLKNFLSSRNYSKCAVLTDTNTIQHCYSLIKEGLPEHHVITVNSGEEFKNLNTCSAIWQELTNLKFDRHSILVVLGGGVLGDMGGFCAATYKRGIDFILIPTTLLSQVDASIGGKLGIDFNHFKNHIGVFQNPVFTLLHSGFLKTLSESEMRSGFAEIIKHTLISDAQMWNTISSRTLDRQNWDELIHHSVTFKEKVTREDPRETGLRKVLNAGHTIGHAIESFLLDAGRKITHGEAIAAGIICENYIACQRNMLPPGQHQEIAKYILAVYGKLNISFAEENAVAQLALQDKKNKGDKILCVLLETPGKVRWDCEITLAEIKGALSFYRSL